MLPISLLFRYVGFTLCFAVPTTEEIISSRKGDIGVHFGRFKRIVGGNDSQNHTWPWLVRILDNARRYQCGGSLVRADVVLTAAHCISVNGPFSVVAGLENLLDDARKVEAYAVEMSSHPNFTEDERPLKNDIALLRLDRPLQGIQTNELVSLPQQGYTVPSGTRCNIIGWGGTQRNNYSFPKRLQQATISVISNEMCNSSQHYDGLITENSMLCAGSNRDEPVADACEGDSGGPLVCRDTIEGLDSEDNSEAAKWVLQGVISYGFQCASRKYPGVYMRVSSFVDWIDGGLRHFDRKTL